MALVSCPECGGMVSDSAAACPHCGYDMRRAEVADDELSGCAAAMNGCLVTLEGCRCLYALLVLIVLIFILVGSIVAMLSS